MQVTQKKSILSIFSNVFAHEASTKQPVAAMRPLSDEELRAVAGGPECEVGSGA